MSTRLICTKEVLEVDIPKTKRKVEHFEHWYIVAPAGMPGWMDMVRAG